MKQRAVKITSRGNDTAARLFGLVVRYAGGERVLPHARALARQSGWRAARERVSPVEMAEEAIRFRRRLEETALQCDGPTATMDPHALELALRIGDVTSEFLVAELEAYAEAHGKA